MRTLDNITVYGQDLIEVFIPQVNSNAIISRDKHARAISGRQRGDLPLWAVNLWFSRLPKTKCAQTKIVCLSTLRLLRTFTIQTDIERVSTNQLRPWIRNDITWAENACKTFWSIGKSDEVSHKFEADAFQITANNWIFNVILTTRIQELKLHFNTGNLSACLESIWSPDLQFTKLTWRLQTAEYEDLSRSSLERIPQRWKDLPSWKYRICPTVVNS